MTTLHEVAAPAGRLRSPRPDEAHVWEASIGQNRPVSDRLINLLDPDERAKAAGFRFDVDRDRYVIAHAMARDVLANYASAAPDRIRYHRNRRGKPYIRRQWRVPALRFSLSYDHDIALFAVTRLSPVGIDVQSHAALVDPVLIERSALSDRELLLASGPERSVTLMRLWARKEALSKALGTGLDDRFRELDVVDAIPRGHAPALRRFHIVDLEVAHKYSAALATSRFCADVVGMTWQPRA